MKTLEVYVIFGSEDRGCVYYVSCPIGLMFDAIQSGGPEGEAVQACTIVVVHVDAIAIIHACIMVVAHALPIPMC